MSGVNREIAGDKVFGDDADAYRRHRPGYPDGVYDLLRERCGLWPGISAFEIGPGTGQASRRLLGLGVDPLVAIEPDARLAAVLSADVVIDGDADRLDLRIGPFDAVDLEPRSFDLGVAATSFHWLDTGPALGRIAGALRPGGWWAMWWNVFGDALGDDPFHNATHHLLDHPTHGSLASESGSLPYPLVTADRIADLETSGRFDQVGFDLIRWVLRLDSAGVAGLYRTFSPIASRPAPERERILAALADVADTQFGGWVDRTILTPVYTARRT